MKNNCMHKILTAFSAVCLMFYFIISGLLSPFRKVSDDELDDPYMDDKL